MSFTEFVYYISRLGVSCAFWNTLNSQTIAYLVSRHSIVENISVKSSCFQSINRRLSRLNELSTVGQMHRFEIFAFTAWVRGHLKSLEIRSSSSSSSWREAFSRLPPLRSFARTVGPPLAAGPRSLLHPCRGRSGGSRWSMVGHWLLWRPLIIPRLGPDS